MVTPKYIDGEEDLRTQFPGALILFCVLRAKNFSRGLAMSNCHMLLLSLGIFDNSLSASKPPRGALLHLSMT